jgi:hypothetical protein
MHTPTVKASLTCGAVVLVALALCATNLGAVTVRGSLTYDGLPLASTFSPYSNPTVKARRSGSETWVSGTINFAASTYEVPGLEAGTHDVYVLLSNDPARSAPSWPRVGELWMRVSGRTVGPTDPTVVDMQMLYAVHLVQPLDGAQRWAGGTACPAGPGLPASFTLAWDPVPRAARYEVKVSRVSCSEILIDETIPTTTTSAQISQGTVSGEQYILIHVRAFGAGGTSLATMPWMSYEQGGSTGTYMHAATSTGRHPGSTTGQHVAQVAHVQGVGTAFWTSDLTLTNPTTNTLSTTLYFTPRGANGLTGYKEASVEVPAGTSRTFADIVSTLFATTGGGALEVTSPNLVVSSRTYTTAPAGGTYGQGYAPIHPDSLITFSIYKDLVGGGVVKGMFRTNLTLNEVWGEEATVRVELYDRDGHKLGHLDQTLSPYGNLQLNDLVARVGGPATLTDGTVKVVPTGGTGKVAGTLSIVDNSTDDPTTVVLEPR